MLLTARRRKFLEEHQDDISGRFRHPFGRWFPRSRASVRHFRSHVVCHSTWWRLHDRGCDRNKPIVGVDPQGTQDRLCGDARVVLSWWKSGCSRRGERDWRRQSGPLWRLPVWQGFKSPEWSGESWMITGYLWRSMQGNVEVVRIGWNNYLTSKPSKKIRSCPTCALLELAKENSTRTSASATIGRDCRMGWQFVGRLIVGTM